ncbi:MAG: hypothetical protein V2B13_18900 [Pseudomonadota bacterium]
MGRKSKLLLGSLGLLVFLTIGVMGWDQWAWETKKTEGLSILQKSLGGLGLGAIASPIWNFINYDPRINPVDDSMTWPIPGGYSYGPDRTAAITYFEEIPKNQWNPLK